MCRMRLMRPHPPLTRCAGLPVLGNALSYLRDPFALLRRLRWEHGPFVHVNMGGLWTYLVSDPALIEQVLVTDNRSYHKDIFLEWMKELLGEGLLTSEDELWLRQRRLSQPAFHRERVQSYGDLMVRCGEDMLRGWGAGGERALHEDLMQLTLRIVSGALFGTSADAVKDDVADALEVFTARYARMLLLTYPSLRRVPLPYNLRFARALRRMDQIVYVVHRDPAYFPEPEAFRPERWEDGLQRRLPRFAYFPSGGGPRLCIGSGFAMMELVLLLAAVVSRYQVRVLPRPRLELLPSVTLRPRWGLRARVTPR